MDEEQTRDDNLINEEKKDNNYSDYFRCDL